MPTPARRARFRRPLAAAAVSAALAGTLVTGGTAATAAAAAAAAPAPAAAVAQHRTSEQRIATAVLALLNRERSRHHLPALTSDVHLISSAHAHNRAMAAADLLSHQLPGEADLGTRETHAGYRWTWAGENIAWNTEMDKSGVLTLERMMCAEKPPNDGHRLNILSTHYRNVGVDVYLDSAHHKAWLTTDFGRH